MVIIAKYIENIQRNFILKNLVYKLPLLGLSVAISMLATLGVFLLVKYYLKHKDKFKSHIGVNKIIIESKDSITKWIENTEKRIKKNNLNIKAKRFIVMSIILFIAAFIFSINIFKSLTASILFSAIFLVIPEYVFSLYEDAVDRKIEDQLITAIKIYTGEFIQKKPLQKIFSTISIKVNDPVGRYFSDAYYELISGTSTEIVLTRLITRFNSNYGKMFIQLVHQSQLDGNIVDLFPELMIKIENHIELTRSNKTNLASDRLQAFIFSLLPIPTYFAMNKNFSETKEFITETPYGRIIITLSFLSIFVFIILDRFIRRVE